VPENFQPFFGGMGLRLDFAHKYFPLDLHLSGVDLTSEDVEPETKFTGSVGIITTTSHVEILCVRACRGVVIPIHDTSR
jgi:hypothetical protein